MNYENEIDLIKVLGWTQSSKMIYILHQLKNKSKEDVYEELVNETKVLKPKSFKSIMNRIDTIRNDIQFV